MASESTALASSSSFSDHELEAGNDDWKTKDVKCWTVEDVKNWLTLKVFKEEAALFSSKLKPAAVFQLTKLKLITCISNFPINSWNLRKSDPRFTKVSTLSFHFLYNRRGDKWRSIVGN